MANEVQRITLTNVNPATKVAVRAAGGSTQQSVTFPVTVASLLALVNALPEFSNSATATGSITQTGGLYSGYANFVFNNGQNVPNIEFVSGALHTLTFSGASAAKTVYGNISIDPSTSTASSVQTAVRAKGAEFALVDVTKTGTGGTSAYVFSYPIGASPAPLVAPTVTVNEVQTLSAPGVDSVALTAQTGGISVTVTSADSASTKQGKLAQNYGVSNGHIIVADSSVLPQAAPNLASGGTATASVNSAGASAAFDNNTSTGWSNGSNAMSLPYWIQYDRGAGNAAVIASYSVTGLAGTSAAATSFTLQGSNNGTDWTVLDSRSQVVYSGGLGSVSTVGPYSVPNNTPWRYYRLDITASGGGTSGGISPDVRELTLTGASVAGSTAYTATFSGASVSGTNQPMMATSTPGVSITETTAGGIGSDPQTIVTVQSPGISAAGINVLLISQGGPGRSYNLLTASGTGTIIDRGAASSTGFVFAAQVWRFDDPASTVTAVIEHSTTGAFAGEQTTIATIPSITGVGDYRVSSASSTTLLNRYIRIKYTVSGGTAPGFVILPVLSAYRAYGLS